MLILFMIVAAASNLDDPGNSPEFWGAVPQSETTYILHRDDGTVDYAGLCQKNRQWVDELLKVDSNAHVFLYKDEPWLGEIQPDDTLFYRLRLDAETATARKNRLLNGWKNAGYVWVDYPDGLRKPVLRTEFELAERARKMAQDLLAKQPEPETPTTVESQAATVQSPGFWTQWGNHFLTGLIGLVLLIVIVKLFFLHPADGWDEVKTPDHF